ncbi:MAG: glycosyl hydrolase [Candidatus Delongbacteria bacterium]|jgi:glucosylceramidase|nr:glycosyl hydrolase [Candidatus Delongbacteria bacterium]
MKEKMFKYILSLIMFVILFGCSNENSYDLTETSEILITSEAGDKMTITDNVTFINGHAESGIILNVNPDSIKQTIDGIGTSFTESSAFVLAHLDTVKRSEVMKNIFGKAGADFTLTRTHIGSCDFTVEGKYSYDDEKGDTDLSSFDISCDSKGFSKKEYPGIKDESYDLMPMIKEALKIKSEQNGELRIISSAWTAPYWMKDIEEWYIPGSPKNSWQGTGGSLKPEYESVYADYIIRYIKEYQKEGVNIWGITPVNEPYGNNGQWESMNFTPESQNEFIKDHLGPKMKESGYSDVKLLIYDQNRDGIEHWTNVLFNDKETAQYIYGIAVHWYESTNKVYEDVFDSVKEKFPQFSIIHTEGCIDDLGKDAPEGVSDPEGYKDENWFNNDEFWWGKNATDWAYTVPWQGVKVEDHPAYVPVHRYARNIIVSIDHWLQGWIDWNIVLDKNGGPNHVGNFCGAPIMIDTDKQFVYYTPIYDILSQFSRTIRPGDQAVQTSLELDGIDKDTIYACATLNSERVLSVQMLNTGSKLINYKLQIGDQCADISIKANSVQTVRVKLAKKGN